MIITRAESDINIGYSYMNNFPDPFKSEKEKLEDKSYIKNTLDYFSNMAYTQYKYNSEGAARNYDLMKGIINAQDFYREADPQIRDFIDTLTTPDQLPLYVKHFPIFDPPINDMVGELDKRPDVHRVKAFDDHSQSEALQYKTEIVQRVVLEGARTLILNKLGMQGQDVNKIPEEQIQKMVVDSVRDELTDYTSLAESWANHMLTALKAQFNTKEKSGECFRDMLITAREFASIYEDNSKSGFSTRVENMKNVWWKGSPNTKYTSAVSGESNVPYAIGTIHVKEISEIIDECQELTIEEIDHLKKGMQNALLMSGKESNLFTDRTGIDTIHYDTYNRLIYQERMMMQAEMGKEWRDDLSMSLGGSNAFSFGYKYVVLNAYWNSKKKVGKLTYIDENGDVQVELVDETYKEGAPNEIDIEWGWVNQWYHGKKIGPDIYYIKPFALFDYSPIIGQIYDSKNTTPKSLLDMMKPYQVIYNICMNQLYELLEKEIGNIGNINIRRIPRPKGASDEDAIDIWEDEARRRGLSFDDDSPENTKGPTQNTSIAKNIDLTRSTEMQTRYNLAMQIKIECWELIGMNRQRLGNPTATETATANQNSLIQSFAQTEPYFSAHYNFLNQYYQALLDAAQYIESRKPLSTINYITSQGKDAFIQVTGDDIKLRDLKVFVISKAEDQQLFNEFRALAQPMLQNGASIYDVSVLYSTNSIRDMQKIFKDFKEKGDQMHQQAIQNEQNQIQQEIELKQQEIEQKERHHQEDLEMEKYGIDVKSNTDLAKAQIANYFQSPDVDANNNGIPDPMDIATHSLKLQQVIEKTDLENRKLSVKMQEMLDKRKQAREQNEIQKQKLKLDKEKNQIMRARPKTAK